MSEDKSIAETLGVGRTIELLLVMTGITLLMCSIAYRAGYASGAIDLADELSEIDGINIETKVDWWGRPSRFHIEKPTPHQGASDE